MRLSKSQEQRGWQAALCRWLSSYINSASWRQNGPRLGRETNVTAPPSLPLFPGSHCSADFGQEWHLGSLEPVACVCVEVMATAVCCAGHGREISPPDLLC